MRKQALIRFVAGCFYYCGLVKLGRWLIRRRGKSLLILNYHRAAGGDLRSHLLYLRRHYRMMHLEEALEELYTQHQGGKQACADRMPLVLTFDDGFRDNYTHGFPIVSELQVPITIFLVPGYIESGNCFWWLAGQHLVRHAQMDEVNIDGCIYHLDRQEERQALAQAIDARVRNSTSVAEREAFLNSTREALSVSVELTDEEKLAFPLTWEEVREMEESGWISFGSHTMNHPVLAYLADPTELKFEVEACGVVLEQQLGHPVRTFAYPLGKSEYIGDKALQAVQEAHYHWALTTIHGINTPQIKRHELLRLEGQVERHWLIMAAETSGVWQIFIAVFRKLKGSIAFFSRFFLLPYKRAANVEKV